MLPGCRSFLVDLSTESCTLKLPDLASCCILLIGVLDLFFWGGRRCRSLQLRHLAEEQLKTEAELERPLSKACHSDTAWNYANCAIEKPPGDGRLRRGQVNDLMDSCRHNHLETIANFNVFKIYKPLVSYGTFLGL